MWRTRFSPFPQRQTYLSVFVLPPFPTKSKRRKLEGSVRKGGKSKLKEKRKRKKNEKLKQRVRDTSVSSDFTPRSQSCSTCRSSSSGDICKGRSSKARSLSRSKKNKKYNDRGRSRSPINSSSDDSISSHRLERIGEKSSLRMSKEAERGYNFDTKVGSMEVSTKDHGNFLSTLLTSVDRHRNLTGGPLQGSFECRRRKGKKSFCAGPGDAVELDPIPVLSSTDVAPLKLKLLNAIAGLNKGFAANKEDLKIVESIAKELESARGPVDLTCNIDMLQGRWKLIYSSAFSSGTLGGSRPGPPTGRLLPITLGKVFQRIDVLSKDFDNIVEVEFGTPWPLPKVEATATLAHKFELIGSSQIKIVFIKTTINPTGNLAQIPPIELPRLPDGLRPPSSGSGEGDFEVTYLDVDTRVTRGDRGELRVFVIS